MPRGGRSRGRSMSPVRSAPRTTAAPRQAPPPAARSSVPAAQAPQQTAMGQPARQGPGMLGQIASTAAGVAIGSAVGHTIGHAMTSGSGGSQEQQQQPDVTYQEPGAAQPYQQQPYQQQPYQHQQPAVCQLEMRQFLECAQTSHDISLCDGFNQALKDCKLQYGVQ